MADLVELLIIGAGLHGLTMAKTYHEAHPTATLLIIDEAHSVGGTWAAERLYPDLKTNNVWGSYELSDFPIVPEKYGAEGKGHIPGRVVHGYFCDVVKEHGLGEFLMLGVRVLRAVEESGVWRVEVESAGSGLETVYAKRLVVATGLTSKPNIPDIPGSETFGRLMIHSKQLREHAESLAKCKRVVVVGGNKSAWDVCYTAARAGSQVDMVIRPGGGGPSYLWPRSFSIGPFRVSLAKLSLVRFFTLFDPAPFSRQPFPWIKRILHRTSLGQKVCRFFWTYLDSLIRRLNGYDGHPVLKKLEPWTTPFWMGNSLSIHNYETSWFDLVREGRTRVHIADIAELTTGRVHLADGGIVHADALVLCTGWTTDIPVQLGGSETDAEEIEEAKRVIDEQVPDLATLPQRTPNAPPRACKGSGARVVLDAPLLYRDVLPVQEQFIKQKNLAFIGMSVSIHAVLVAQAQALWITALFSDKIDNLQGTGIGMIKRRAVIDRTYGAMRRPQETGGLAGRRADLVFDSLPYVDGLLDDLRMQSRRKGTWWRELTEAYGARDYRGLVQEWMLQVTKNC